MTEPRHDPWTSHGPDAAGSPSTLTRPRGAGRPAASSRRRPGTPWWRWTLLVLLALAALVFGMVRCGAERDAQTPAAPAAGTPAAGLPGAGIPGPAAAPVAGSLTAGVTSLFDAARSGDRGLTTLVGQTAIGHAVPVQSVDADEGFWIGTGPTDRVWVQLSTDDESTITITAGQLLDLTGPIVSHGADFARKAGVNAAEGSEQLTREGAHLEVAPNKITVVGTR